MQKAQIVLDILRNPEGSNFVTKKKKAQIYSDLLLNGVWVLDQKNGRYFGNFPTKTTLGFPLHEYILHPLSASLGHSPTLKLKLGSLATHRSSCEFLLLSFLFPQIFVDVFVV